MGERVAIVGTREKFWKHPWWVERCVRRYVNKLLSQDDVVVSGGAAGADAWSADAARQRGLEVVEYLPDWDAHGKGAGFKRNWAIIKDCDRVVAFWDGISKGTQHTLDAAAEVNKPVTVINPELHVPDWWAEPGDYAF